MHHGSSNKSHTNSGWPHNSNKRQHSSQQDRRVGTTAIPRLPLQESFPSKKDRIPYPWSILLEAARRHPSHHRRLQYPCFRKGTMIPVATVPNLRLPQVLQEVRFRLDKELVVSSPWWDLLVVPRRRPYRPQKHRRLNLWLCHLERVGSLRPHRRLSPAPDVRLQ